MVNFSNENSIIFIEGVEFNSYHSQLHFALFAVSACGNKTSVWWLLSHAKSAENAEFGCFHSPLTAHC